MGKIISGFVRVGDGGASGSGESWRTCILKAYGALTVFEEFAFLMHADKRNQTRQLFPCLGRERIFMILKISYTIDVRIYKQKRLTPDAGACYIQEREEGGEGEEGEEGGGGGGGG